MPKNVADALHDLYTGPHPQPQPSTRPQPLTVLYTDQVVSNESNCATANHYLPPSPNPFLDRTTLEITNLLLHDLQDSKHAFATGLFKNIIASRLSLPAPREPPDPRTSSNWIERLPNKLQEVFSGESKSFLTLPILHHLILDENAAEHRDKIPAPTVHSSKEQYLLFLSRAEESGILSWIQESSESQTYRQLAPHLELTLFAVSKTEKTDRLISWPRTQNMLMPEPPYTPLPDPSLYSSIHQTAGKLQAFSLDVANQFHNIVLPQWLARLFPMKPVCISQLDNTTAQRVRSRLNLEPGSNCIVRPCQATLPMGFKWSVYIAQNFTASCISQAYDLLLMSNPTLPKLPSAQHFLSKEAPFVLSARSALILHIIDDVSVVTSAWSERQVIRLNVLLRRILKSVGLPIQETKSTPIGMIQSSFITFLGCEWNLKSGLIRVKPGKTEDLIYRIEQLVGQQSTNFANLTKIIGQTVFNLLINRPLLAILNSVFRIRWQATQAPRELVEIPKATKRELLLSSKLFQRSVVSLELPISQQILAFDASSQAGAAVTTTVSLEDAQQLWMLANTRYDETELQDSCNIIHSFVRNVVTQNKWKVVFVHKWKREEHINALEIAAATLSLSYVIRSGMRNSHLILLTDSLVVLGALNKGRSSSVPLLLRCRQIAAMLIAQNIPLSVLHVPSKYNPADAPSRSTTKLS